MINKATIKNFQSLRDCSIEFSPGINTITGPSDEGKSAILRALRWALLNMPKGDHFRTFDTKKTSVELELDDGTITRIKGSSENAYVINGTTHRAFGTQPPEEALSLHNLTEINIQRQTDGYFWFSLTPAEVSKRLNDIVDLSLLDVASTNINKRQRQVNQKLKWVQERLAEAREKKKELNFIKEAKKE